MSLVTIVAAAEGHAEVAAAEGQKAGLFEALGLDLKLLLVNAIAFLILLAILSRFVYPALIKAIDSRREQIEAGLAEAKKSQEAAEDAEKRVESLLAEARKDADEIISRAQTESNATVAAAEDKARLRADQIVKDARAQLESDIVKARAALKKDTLQLVALATEKVVGEKLDAAKDAKLLERALSQKPEAAGDRA